MSSDKLTSSNTLFQLSIKRSKRGWDVIVEFDKTCTYIEKLSLLIIVEKFLTKTKEDLNADE